MIPFRRILYPVDLSEPSRRAVPYVKAMAERFHSEIVVLHVMEVPTAMYAPPEGAAWTVLTSTERLKEHRRQLFDSFIQSEFGATPVQAEFVEGDAAREITSVAQREKAGLIMMMTHGHGPFRRLLLGSVSAKVLHDSSGPLWTGVHEVDLVAHDPTRFRTILCAVDTPQKDAHVIEWANSFAQQTGAQVHMVHALAHPEEVVHFEADKIGADVVVIGRTHSKLGALRSNAYEIIRQAPCPVISV
jgi:nucleotide-binding universal stress UspA family protein